MGTLYESIISLCNDKGIKGGKMCVDLGISKSTMTDLKSGRRTGISMDTAQKIADYFGVSVDRVLGTEQKEKPTATNGSELTEEAIQLAKKINSAAPDVQRMVKAILADNAYMPKIVEKAVDVVCPLTGRIETIYQSYYLHDGKRLPRPNNGCDNCHKCPECESCQVRVMESVR